MWVEPIQKFQKRATAKSFFWRISEEAMYITGFSFERTENVAGVGLAISDKKIIPRKTESTELMVNSGGIPAVPRKTKLSEFRSEPLQRR